jgi:ribonuclease E
MTKEIYISSTPHETRLAVVEDEQLAEIYYERENEYTLAGSVYKGKVTRVLPGMQSAFVDIGLERDAFLYVTDFAEEQEDGEEYVPLTQGRAQGQSHQPAPTSSNGHSETPSQPHAAQKKAADITESSEDGESGGRRWRGRRGRRRGRGNPPQQTQSPVTPLEIESQEPAIVPGLNQIGYFEPEAATPETAPAQPEVTVLPGESLSKYRRGQGSSAPSEAASQSRLGYTAPSIEATSPAPTFQPSTMVVAPLAWDGSDILPGESLSRHKNKPARSTSDAAATSPSPSAQTELQDAALASSSPAAEIGAAAHEQSPILQEHPLREHPLVQHPIGSHEETHNVAIEPEEASASYRFDPSAPSAYRQSSIAEPVAEEPVAEITSSAQTFPPAEPEIISETEDRREDAIEDPAPTHREPFFGEFASTAQAQPETSSIAAEITPSSHEFVGENNESDEEVSDESESDAHDAHAFDPGHGNLEEEMIDEEEPEAYTAQTLGDDEEYDDLVEETLDVQDSGLLSELVRDQHIDERTGYAEDHGAGPEAEDDSFDEEQSFDDDSFGIELEEVTDSNEDSEDAEDTEASNADATRTRSNAPRTQRRGVRGQRPGQGGNRGGRMRRSTAQTTNLPAITELLKPNQEILVQIAKEPIARKGARITSHIALPGRFLVFMPTVNHVGVSRKISSDEERQRLKHILLSEKGTASGGFIVRTAASTASEEDLRADIRFLLTLWAEMRQRAENSKPPALIYHDLSLVERVLRDQVTDNFSAIWVDSESDYERVLRFLNRFEPALVRRVKLYTKETPLFEQFGIQEEINKALRSKVWLKSGGSIVINQTEALVAIDINTGKYVGKTARLEDTILKTNLDAIPEIVRQIRLRDLGGIIVIDFIDMDERKNRNKVMVALEDALKSDRAPSKVLQFNDFGLVAITRKRVKQSLERTLSVPCSTCTGTGMVKGPLTVCNEIYIELRKMHRQIDRGDVMLRVHPEVVKQLKAINGRWLSEMEEMSGKSIIVKSDATLHPEQFDIH